MQFKHQVLAQLYINGSDGINVTSYLKEHPDITFEHFLKIIQQINFEFTLTNQCLVINRYHFVFILEVNISTLNKVIKQKKSIITLSQISMEILAIISQNLNITRPEINKIRGINSDVHIKKLIENKFIRITGKDPSKANSKMLALDVEFYKYFNLDTLEKLPKMESINLNDIEDSDIEFLSNKLNKEEEIDLLLVKEQISNFKK